MSERQSENGNARGAEWTEGPWVVDPGEHRSMGGEHRSMGGERIFKVCQRSGGLIADVSAWWVDTRSAEANARLIAQAPDLAEALEELSGLVHLYQTDAYNNDTYRKLGEANDKARTALARAKGEG